MIIKHDVSKQQNGWLMSLLAVIIIAGVAIITLSLVQLPASAQNTSDLPEIALSQVASGLVRPVHITHADDGTARLFIVEQAGQIWFLKDGSLHPTPFLDIRDRVQSPAAGGGNEQGLLGLAFPPGYTDKGYFYVYYTMLSGDNVLSRFHLSGDPNLADPESEEQILVFPHPTYSNHNGGQIAFAPDGTLYIGTGDGGGGGDPLGNAQDPSSLNGKLLRINVESSSPQPAPLEYLYYFPIFCKQNEQNNTGDYTIPEDNPFVNNPDFRPEIWALGLRNPWRFSFDRLTGDLFIADVGQNRWEEVNYQPAGSPGGENYGWNIMEGEECYQSASCDTSNLTLPVHVYPIFSSTNCSITGGSVYRGQAYPALNGIYLFGDFCSGNIWGLTHDGAEWQSGLIASTTFRISTFGEDEAGEIYLADLSGGGIYQVVLP